MPNCEQQRDWEILNLMAILKGQNAYIARDLRLASFGRIAEKIFRKAMMITGESFIRSEDFFEEGEHQTMEQSGEMKKNVVDDYKTIQM